MILTKEKKERLIEILEKEIESNKALLEYFKKVKLMNFMCDGLTDTINTDEDILKEIKSCKNKIHY